MPHPNKLIGRCSTGMKHTCTEKGNFAYDLLRLGKQNRNSTTNNNSKELQESIVGRFARSRYNVSEVPYMTNPVFLYDMEQLADRDPQRRAQFAGQLQQFLGLATPLPHLPHVQPGRHMSNEQQRRLNAMKMDICRSEFEPVRRELMGIAQVNANWLIQSDFVQDPTVTVPNLDHFRQIIQGWQRDPCDTDATIIREQPHDWKVQRRKVG